MPLRRLSFKALGTNCEVQYAAPGGATQAEGFERAVTAWVALTRPRHLRLTSVYLADSTCPQADGIHMDIAQTLAQELREEGRVPFVVCGDWNCEPSTGQCWWTGPGKLVPPGSHHPSS